MKFFLAMFLLCLVLSCTQEHPPAPVFISDTKIPMPNSSPVKDIPDTKSFTTIKVPNFISPLEGTLLLKSTDQFPKSGDGIIITSEFGERMAVVKGSGGGDSDLHKGTDLVPLLSRQTVDKSAKILASADGIVYIHYPPPGNGFKGHPVYGSLIILDHGNGIYTLYGHMKETWVSERQKIKQGDPMGIIGSTGISTGVHLHWEICYNPIVILQESDLFSSFNDVKNRK